jgi:hypothetical protein
MIEEDATVSSSLGSAATLALDTPETDGETVETRLLTHDGDEPFGVELTLDLGPLTAETVLDGAATRQLANQLDVHATRLGE